MKYYIGLLLNTLRGISNRKRCVADKNVEFYYTSTVNLTWGSVKNNIIIGCNSRIYGRITSCKDGKICIGRNCALGPGSRIMSVNRVSVGDYTVMGPNATVCDNNNHPINPDDRMIMRLTPRGSFERSWINSISAPIEIGKNVWIGENARICKGIIIGDGAIIGANSVVTKNVPANSIAAGNPAKVVKEGIDKLPRIFNQ